MFWSDHCLISFDIPLKDRAEYETFYVGIEDTVDEVPDVEQTTAKRHEPDNNVPNSCIELSYKIDISRVELDKRNKFREKTRDTICLVIVNKFRQCANKGRIAISFSVRPISHLK